MQMNTPKYLSNYKFFNIFNVLLGTNTNYHHKYAQNPIKTVTSKFLFNPFRILFLTYLRLVERPQEIGSTEEISIFFEDAL